MKVEIVEFYEEERDDSKQFLRGSLHVFLPELNIDIRGCSVSKKKNWWHITLPFRKGFDQEKAEFVRYPVFSFLDRAKNEEFIREVRREGRLYVEEKMKIEAGKVK